MESKISTAERIIFHFSFEIKNKNPSDLGKHLNIKLKMPDITHLNWMIYILLHLPSSHKSPSQQRYNKCKDRWADNCPKYGKWFPLYIYRKNSGQIHFPGYPEADISANKSNDNWNETSSKVISGYRLPYSAADSSN